MRIDPMNGRKVSKNKKASKLDAFYILYSKKNYKVAICLANLDFKLLALFL